MKAATPNPPIAMRAIDESSLSSNESCSTPAMPSGSMGGEWVEMGSGGKGDDESNGELGGGADSFAEGGSDVCTTSTTNGTEGEGGHGGVGYCEHGVAGGNGGADGGTSANTTAGVTSSTVIPRAAARRDVVWLP